MSKGRRREALAFFRAQCNLPGSLGVIAQRVYDDLYKIHKASYLTGAEKEAGFQLVIRTASAQGEKLRAAAQAAASA